MDTRSSHEGRFCEEKKNITVTGMSGTTLNEERSFARGLQDLRSFAAVSRYTPLQSLSSCSSTASKMVIQRCGEPVAWRLQLVLPAGDLQIEDELHALHYCDGHGRE